MEIGKIPVALPALTKINDELNKMVKTLATSQLRNVLSDISDKYGIAKNELFARYLSTELSLDLAKENGENGSVEITKSRRTRKAIASEDRCLAKISNGTRCSRRKKDGNVYCGSHLTSRPFGEFSATDATDDCTEAANADAIVETESVADTLPPPPEQKKTKIILARKKQV